MKKYLVVFLSMCLCLSACQMKIVKNRYTNGIKDYYEMSDGTWLCEGISYDYRLVIKGRLNAAVSDTVYVYLSNLPEITFEQAWKASGLSSYSGDYFEINEAILVEIETD